MRAHVRTPTSPSIPFFFFSPQRRLYARTRGRLDPSTMLKPVLLLRQIQNARSHRPLATALLHSPSAMSGEAAPDVADAVPRQKRVLRARVRRDLASLPLPQRRLEDAAIQNAVVDSSWFRGSRSICAYVSCEALREVDTSKILSEFLHSLPDGDHTQNERKLYVPRVEDKQSNMCMLRISHMEDLVANSMNILEPSPLDVHGNPRGDVLLSDDPVDLFILPGVAFDMSGRRLGRGGGYYDVFLKKYQELAHQRNWRQPLLVALAYSVQVMDQGVIPVNSRDALVDAIVSPSGVSKISTSAMERM